MKTELEVIKFIELWLKDKTDGQRETWFRLKERLTEQGFKNLAKLLELESFKKHV